ncbi:MAG: hypothetical protein JNM67_11380, partial [Bacteroidetes bacterium]|nr:hypothetical protein [Bacteroidota bacterium]
MIKARLLSFAIVISTIEAFASGDSSKIKIVDAYLLGGGYSSATVDLTIQEYRNYLPQSTILLND